MMALLRTWEVWGGGGAGGGKHKKNQVLFFFLLILLSFKYTFQNFQNHLDLKEEIIFRVSVIIHTL